MAVSYKRAKIRVEGPDFYELREQFRKLPKNIAARVIGAGLKRAAAPGEKALRANVDTMDGPTGNLRRAIKTEVKRYPKDGAAVALVGFIKAGTAPSKSAAGGTVRKGKDRGFHQFWLEFGTKERHTKAPAARGGYIASSYRRLGPFVIKTAKQGKNAGRFRTAPGYPKAFFKKSTSPVFLRSTRAQYPVKRAYDMARSAISANLTAEMKKALENGRKIFEDQSRRATQMRELGSRL